MAKVRTRFVCQECGRVSATMMGRCPGCGQFGTILEEYLEPEVKSVHKGTMSSDSKPRKLTEITGDAEARMHLPIGEFSRVLGGGNPALPFTVIFPPIIPLQSPR